MQDYIIGLVNQLIPILLTLVAAAIVFGARKFLKNWLPKIEAWIATHTSAKQREVIKCLGQEAFAYAETVYREKNGADKLKAALTYFNKNMSNYGLSNLNSDTIRAAIERAWLEDKRLQYPEIELSEVRVGGTE